MFRCVCSFFVWFCLFARWVFLVVVVVLWVCLVFPIESIQECSVICPGTFATERIPELMGRSPGKERTACPQTESYSGFPKPKLSVLSWRSSSPCGLDR